MLTTSKRKQPESCSKYRVSREWGENSIWRDCIIADITSGSVLDMDGSWNISDEVINELQLLCTTQDDDGNDTMIPDLSPEPPLEIQDLDDKMLGDFLSTCLPALSLVSELLCNEQFISQRKSIEFFALTLNMHISLHIAELHLKRMNCLSWNTEY